MTESNIDNLIGAILIIVCLVSIGSCTARVAEVGFAYKQSLKHEGGE